MDFSYSKFSPSLIILACLIVIGVASFPLGTIMKDTGILFTVGIVDMISVIVLFVFGISPLLTNHSVTDNFLMLRQGLYFSAEIPLIEVEDIGVWSGKAKGLGISFDKENERLYVVTRNENLVRIVLKERRRFGARRMKTREVVINVDDPKRFVYEIAKRID